jgi:hypothetical protein
MTAIALEIIGYWFGLGVFMWVVMYSALSFARLCEFVTDHLFS